MCVGYMVWNEQLLWFPGDLVTLDWNQMGRWFGILPRVDGWDGIDVDVLEWWYLGGVADHIYAWEDFIGTS